MVGNCTSSMSRIAALPARGAGTLLVLANGIGGLEGGPAQFNLAALCGGGSSGGSSMKCEDYGGGQFKCSNQRTGIGMISEGGGKGAVFIDGKVIMTPN